MVTVDFHNCNVKDVRSIKKKKKKANNASGQSDDLIKNIKDIIQVF